MRPGLPSGTVSFLYAFPTAPGALKAAADTVPVLRLNLLLP